MKARNFYPLIFSLFLVLTQTVVAVNPYEPPASGLIDAKERGELLLLKDLRSFQTTWDDFLLKFGATKFLGRVLFAGLVGFGYVNWALSGQSAFDSFTSPEMQVTAVFTGVLISGAIVAEIWLSWGERKIRRRLRRMERLLSRKDGLSKPVLEEIGRIAGESSLFRSRVRDDYPKINSLVSCFEETRSLAE